MRGRFRGGIFGGVGFGRLGILSFVLQNHFLAEAEALNPVLYFAAGMLRGLFIVAEIKNQEGMSHVMCITGLRMMCQASGTKSCATRDKNPENPSSRC